MTEPIADGLSVAGLVIGFPLLLLGFMISLEKLETWGLRDTEPDRDATPPHDTVEAAVRDVEHLSAMAERESPSTVVGRSSG